jgi:hypothetical protein
LAKELMLQIAFKEWAVICQALAHGRQALILRKGGVSEGGGVFKPEHSRFWLYPTFVHQQRDGIKRTADPLLRNAEADRPPAGAIRLQYFAEVSGAYFVRHLEDALALDRFHLWSETTIRQRFAYREPGLFALPVRVYRMPAALELVESPEYEGCKTWVSLERELTKEGAMPVLDSRPYAEILEEIDGILNPTAFA